MLEINQIQSLTNRNAIAAFFAALGYNVNARLEQTAANLGISPESTVRRIKHIERIANQEDYFQIYLFEVDSVTVDMTRSLARTFRDFQGHFLLVLTSDYERIDFVLVETLLPGGESPGPMQSQQKRGFRPLALSVKRLAPGRVDLRVLARFEYTEADPQAQYEKLLSAYSVAFWSEENFNNRALFSDYFLVERLRDRPEWREDIAAPFATLHGLLTKGAASFAGHPEAFLRTALLLPTFDALGFVAKEQKKATDDVQKPDFSLHAGNASEPVTLALTYCWNRNLDGPDDTRDPDTPQENPSQTVITVMEQGLCDWAIVTNGKIWRLYSKKAHSRATNYYEIDLPEILALPDSSEAFRYFWLFFRSLAFVSSGEAEDRKCFLDELLDGSEIYAKKLGERLKDRVFREVFPHFADGFVAGIGGTEKLLALPVEERSALLSEFFQGTLTFLYRILFLSYAEARDLLPVKERRGYYQKSLLRIKEELREKGGQSESTRAGKLAKTYGLSGRDLYDRLTELFTLIDKGDPSINLPTYNGGLFMTKPADGDDTEEAAHARFLRDHFIPDRHLAMGLDLMARVEDEKKLELVFIDYKSLGVRQLGSIYEGLLEFKVDIATEKLGVVKLKGKDVYRPWRELSDREHKATERRGDVIDQGDIYLSNDKSERKATGSYYTPDYIVKYIVEHAVGPVLQEKFDAMRPKLREAQRRYKESVELNRQRAKAGSKSQDPDLVVGNTYADLAEGLFDLKVLDPAMGSGHFLVEVVDFVTDRIIDFLNGFPWNPVVSRLRRMRESILQHMDESGISIDHARLTDTNLLKRHVLKRCIYGVDINPMAVELAKVSLWLDCFTIGAPLSFLDHHLKPGNSLIGTDIATVTKAVETKQLLLFSSSKFAGVMLGADLMRQVGRLSDVTLEQMNQSRREYKRARDELAPYKRLLDVYVSRWFGNALVKEIATVRDQQSRQARKGKIDRDYAVEFLQSADAERWAQNPGQLDGMEKLHRQIAERTMTASKTQRFFHWELEFPEVYYGPRPGTTQMIERMENAGFDAVVGNPPYVRVQRLVYDDTDYFKDIYSAAYRRVDIAALFLQQSTLLLGERRTCSLILSDQFIVADYGQELREFLLVGTSPLIVDLKDLPIFEDVLTYCCICTLQKNIAAYAVHYVDLFNPQLKAHPELIPSALKKATLEAFNKSLLTKNPWVFAGVDKASIFTRLSLVGVPLGTMADAKTGLFTGLDEVLMVYPEIERTLRLEEDVLLPVASGTEPDRYHLNPTQKKVIYPYDDKGDNTVLMSESDLKSKYPKVYAYLRKSKEQLERRRDSRKSFSENKTWYQLTRHGSLALFRSPKLFTPGEVQHNSFCYDEVGVAFSVARVFAITSQKVNLWYLLAILNSKLMELQLKAISPPKQGGYSAYSSAFLEKALICRVDGLGGRARKPDCDQNLYATFISLVGNGKCLRSDEIMAFANDRVSAECGDLQSLHDLLVYLAKKMTEGHKQKQNEMGRFHLHLGKTLRFGADSHGNHGIDTLSGKIRLQNYIGDFQKNESELSFAELEKILFKNRSRLGVNLSDAGLMRQLREEYEKSLATLLPLKRQLAATDALIDQIVYKLYGLTKSEIAIVEGKSVTRPVEVSTRPPQDTEQYTPVARVGDPRVLLEVIAASALLGPATVAEVAANVTDRALISLGFDEAEDIVREFTRLGWMTQETLARVALSKAGIPLAKGDASRSPYVFARTLALAHEKSSGRMVSRILGRLWELNPTHQGAVIIPHPQLPESVIEPDAIEAWIEAQRPKWLKSLEQQMPGFVPALPSARFVTMVRESAGDAWPTKPKAPRDKERLQKSITQQFMQMMFGNLRLPLRDLEIWQSRLDWAGLTMTARNLPGVAGWVWFPVGAFRDKPGEGFRLVEGLVWQDKLFYAHEPTSQEFEGRFLDALFREYAAISREERIEYVSMPTVRDRTCYRLRIGAATFERVLAAIFPKSVRGDVPYGMALEVDITPAERARQGTTIPVVIDHTPRHIISMRKK